MAKAFIDELVDGQPVTSYFLAKQVQVRQRRSGEPYLTLVLADRTGELPAVMWEGVDDSVRSLSDGDIVKVQAVLGSYRGEPQLTVTRARKAGSDEVSPDDYLPRAEGDPATMLLLRPQLQSYLDRNNVAILLHDWEDYLLTKGGMEDYAPVKAEEEEGDESRSCEAPERPAGPAETQRRALSPTLSQRKRRYKKRCGGA